MKLSHPIPQRLLTGALVCFSCLGAFADTPPTTPVAPNPATNSTAPVAVTPPTNPLIPIAGGHILAPPAPLQLPKTLTNLNISYPAVPYGESVKLLDAKVSFKVKDASFLAALDGVLSSANITCNVECRGVKAMKLSLDLKEVVAGPLLDGLAKAGGARLWVFATKLLIAPEALLTKDEKKTAKLYGVLVTKETLPVGNTLGKVDTSTKSLPGDIQAHLVQGVKLLDLANSRIPVELNNSSWISAFDDVENHSHLTFEFGGYKRMSIPPKVSDASGVTLSASFEDISYGDALAFTAHAFGDELFIVPDGFLICEPNSVPASYKGHTVPAFTSDSTHFDFSPNPILNPSAKGS